VVRQHSMSGNVVSPFERHGPVQVRGRQEYAVFQYVKAVRLQNLAAFCVAGWAGKLVDAFSLAGAGAENDGKTLGYRWQRYFRTCEGLHEAGQPMVQAARAATHPLGLRRRQITRSSWPVHASLPRCRSHALTIMPTIQSRKLFHSGKAARWI
jgi:hypothetical protein